MPEISVLNTLLAATSLIVSGVTLFLNFFYKPKILMSTPPRFTLRSDQPTTGERATILLECTFFASSNRGRSFDALYAQIDYGGDIVTFPEWHILLWPEKRFEIQYGRTIDGNGIGGMHHFVSSSNKRHAFRSGPSKLEFYFLDLHGRRTLIRTIDLDLGVEEAELLKTGNTTLSFSWQAPAGRFSKSTGFIPVTGERSSVSPDASLERAVS